MLPKARRLSASAFAANPRGTLYHEPHLALKVSRIPADSSTASPASIPSKFACIVSKKVDKRAVKRNLIRRRCMNALRPKLPSLPPGFMCIFSAKKGVLEITYKEFELEISSLLAKAFPKSLIR